MTRDLRLPMTFVAVLLLAASLNAAAQSLTAGDVDDHLNWDHYMDYLDRFGQQQQSDLPGLGFGDRATLIIEDRDGDPLGGATVTITTGSGNISLRSGMDGALRVMPQADDLGTVEPATIIVQAPDGTRTDFERDLADPGPHHLTIDTDAGPATALDLMFVIDTTGSMKDELAYITNELTGIVSAIESAHPNVDINFGLIVYRDQGDDYVVRDLGFTNDLPTMQSRLAAEEAAGGGDYPEAMDEALQAGVDSQWRSNAVRLLFLVADAPPHRAGYEPMLDAAKGARQAGIHIHPLAASGVADEAEYLMRAAAALTHGRYMFLTDDSGIGNAHAEPSIPCYVVTNLDDLMVRIVASGITGTRVEPDPQDIVRESGRYQMGVCLGDPDPEQVDDGSGGTSESTAATEGHSDTSADTSTSPSPPTDPADPAADPEPGTGDVVPATGADGVVGSTGGDDDGDPSASSDEASDDEATPGPAVLGTLLAMGLAASWLRRRPDPPV